MWLDYAVASCAHDLLLLSATVVRIPHIRFNSDKIQGQLLTIVLLVTYVSNILSGPLG